VLASLVLAACAPQVQPVIVDITGRPNIVLILGDDLDRELVSHFPLLQEALAGAGTTFSNAFVDVSASGPSRLSLLKSEYGHNTTLFGSTGGSGVFERAHQLKLEQSTVATWLHDAGYRTALVGQYLTGYPGVVSPAYVPPGWDTWVSPVGGTPYAGLNYQLNENGRIVKHGRESTDYMQDVLADRASTFIHSVIGADGKRTRPFFLYLAPYVPHQPATPAVRYQPLFPGVTAPRPPSFDEADTSDKPAWVNQARLTDPVVASIDPIYRRRLQATASLQDVVLRTIAALAEVKQLDNTYVFFTSDDGFHLGQHRLAPGKQTAYEEDIHVPLLVRGPGVPQGATLPHLVLNIDLAPTFGELGRARYGDRVDGRSLVPVLGASPPPQEEWRHAILVEHEPAAVAAGAARPTPSRAPAGFEPPDPQDQAGVTRTIPAYRAIRTQRYAFVEYDTGEKELYDLDRDPYELDSIHASAEPGLIARLSKMLDDLRRCSGRACLAAENATP